MNQKYKGIFFIILAGFFFSLMTFFVRISGDLPTFEKAFFRNAVAMVIAFFTLLKSKDKFKLHSKKSIPYLLARSIGGVIGIVCNFYAIDRLNLSDANMLNKLSPFFAIVFSYFIIKEIPSKVDWAAVFIAFAGSLLIIKPSFSMTFIYALIGAAGGMGAGFAYACVRKLGSIGERPPFIVFFFSTFSSAVLLPLMILTFEPITPLQLLFLILAGASAAGGQFCITTAYTCAPAKEISVFDYTQILFAALLGFLFLDQIPDWMSFLGYVVIIGCAVFKWRYNLKRE